MKTWRWLKRKIIDQNLFYYHFIHDIIHNENEQVLIVEKIYQSWWYDEVKMSLIL